MNGNKSTDGLEPEETKVDEIELEENALRESEQDAEPVDEPPFNANTKHELRDEDTIYEPREDEGMTSNADPDSEDDDFGSFDDASFNLEPASEKGTMPDPGPIQESYNTDSLLGLVTSRIQRIFSDATEPSHPSVAYNPNLESHILLNERSHALYSRLSTVPRLTPQDWKKSKIRRHLLVNLSIPVDLGDSHRRNIDEEDLFSYTQYKDLKYEVPDLSDLKLTASEQEAILDSPEARITEAENISQKSVTYLQTLSVEELAALEAEMSSIVGSLEAVNAVWLDRLKKLKHDNTTYESVVENFVGHTQRLTREEILKKVTLEKQKKKRMGFWGK
ncbi:hypothetical protein BABINDRAFT_8767 [Babjeviella inositovora NRRL Y-12698]|uniref:Uncharacterized protein n=1 Tax=Babjeviella inositovora NRRL Y-12698 TaxID=984486 RepID=A0A1E3QN95_9ASCO|nr:uncharacterized protein BABINDRAFT_8767 [Babjeviella inositovora NRRL Y-12698]ODQ79179.1 hypothetical protein BABINDRAFT_8767 [Babjeviella inositovora NRRL Y-12698]